MGRLKSGRVGLLLFCLLGFLFGAQTRRRKLKEQNKAEEMTDPQLMTGLGAAAAIFFASLGSSIASAPAGTYAISSSSGLKSFCPIIIAGVLAIYGIIVAVILCGKLGSGQVQNETEGYRHFSAGLSVGLACLASGVGLAKFLQTSLTPHYNTNTNYNTNINKYVMTDADNQGLLSGSTAIPRATEPAEPTVKFIMVLCFIEAIGLYGLIVALLLSQ